MSNDNVKTDTSLNRLNKRQEELKEITIKKLTDDTNFVFDSLVATKENSKLPEEIFVNYFLPFFSGKVEVSKEPVLSNWIGIAGTPMSEVDVVDTKGDKIFTVPALFDTNIIDVVNRERGRSLQDIFSNYEVRNNNIPVIASKFLDNELNKKNDELIHNKTVSATNTELWNNIFKRYGIENNETKTISKTPDENGADDLEYD